MSAVAVAKDVFAARKIGADQLPEASPKPLALDEAAEAQRAARVSEQFGTVAPGVVQYTTDILFRDLWLRPDLAPRDRSLVTVSALIASGQVAQIPYHLNRAMENGLTREQAGEVLDTPGLLRGLAERLFGPAGREGGLREASALKVKAHIHTDDWRFPMNSRCAEDTAPYAAAPRQSCAIIVIAAV